MKKEFLVEIPFSDLDDLKQKKLKDISEKVKIAGFRPGKVPMSHVEKLYGKETIVEVIEEKVSESFIFFVFKNQYANDDVTLY